MRAFEIRVYRATTRPAAVAIRRFCEYQEGFERSRAGEGKQRQSSYGVWLAVPRSRRKKGSRCSDRASSRGKKGKRGKKRLPSPSTISRGSVAMKKKRDESDEPKTCTSASGATRRPRRRGPVDGTSKQKKRV